MIIRSFFFTLVLLSAYAIFLSQMENVKHIGQHQWQDNIIKAQDYIYAENQNKLNIIIGSSLSSRIVMDSLPNNFYNLSFGGQSLFDGLNIIMNAHKKPNAVFIETNFIEKAADVKFGEGLFMPVVSILKGKINFLQEKNQPLSFVGNFISPIVGRNVLDPFAGKYFNRLINIVKPKKVNQEDSLKNFYQILVNKQVDNFSTTLDEKEMLKKILFLKKSILALEKDSVKIIFFEMPMHPALENTSHLKMERKLLQQYFPVSEYRYLPKPNYSNYETTDALHLGSKEALKFTSFFKLNINN